MLTLPMIFLGYKSSQNKKKEKKHHQQIMSELDRALDQIQTGQINQGIENWERCFHDTRDQLSLTEALYLQAELAQVLVDIGLIKDAKNIDQRILDQLSEDGDDEYQLVRPKDRARLDKEIEMRYARKAARSGLVVEDRSSDERENRSQSGITSTVIHSMDHPLHFRENKSKAELQIALEDVEARTRAVTSDEAHPERRPRLSKERVGIALRAAE
jgi:hypothetical protein